jgi:hypothetical protein
MSTGKNVVRRRQGPEALSIKLGFFLDKIYIKNIAINTIVVQKI